MGLIFYCAVVGILAVLLFYWLSRPQQATTSKRGLTKPTLYKHPDTCRDIISGKNPKDPSLPSILSPLESRSKPNQRLVQTFGVDNAFTTTNEKYLKNFKRHVENLLKADDATWKQTGETASQLVHHGQDAARREDFVIMLVPLVQDLVLRISIQILFEIPAVELEHENIKAVASKINRLWVDSKGSKAGDATWESNGLQKSLAGLFSGFKSRPRRNALDLILPAYETLWRIVLRCFLEVRFRTGQTSGEWRQLFLAYLEDPTKPMLEASRGEGPTKVSVAFIVNEALRLYPPTRRIYREMQVEAGSQPELVGADIESLQRDPSIWGDDPLSFRPSRWNNMNEERYAAFMPFGSKPYMCPARPDFGPRMIGLLVAVLLAEFSSGWVLHAEERRDVITMDEPLALDRDFYGSLGLERE
ncbi:hypothetical protein MMC06_001955 [Schaereria dolodes]|nr:hypothetical protein [Schaereria dolodes]